VNPNLRIKSRVSLVLLCLLDLLLLFTLLLSLACDRSSLLSSVDLAYGLSSCSLVGRLFYSAFHSPALL
jgi:hypothetical protein